MEPQLNKPESIIAPLKKVTPLSKYLAMVIFILMPFVGGYIGYTYAPEKIVEIEKVTVSDKNPIEDKDTEAVESIDFSKCEPQLESGGWEAQELIIVLGESLFDNRCHVLRYTASALGDGGYQMEECWVPMSVGKISAEAPTTDGKTFNPAIPDEYCKITTQQGTFKSEINKKES